MVGVYIGMFVCTYVHVSRSTRGQGRASIRETLLLLYLRRILGSSEVKILPNSMSWYKLASSSHVRFESRSVFTEIGGCGRYLAGLRWVSQMVGEYMS